MHETSASGRTLYPYERRRHGRWRFGTLGVLAMLSLVPMPAQAADPIEVAPPGDGWMPVPDLWMPEEEPGIQWFCRDLGVRTLTLEAVHDWYWDLTGLYMGLHGAARQTTSLYECMKGGGCHDGTGNVQTIGFYRVQVQSTRVTDDLAYLRPVNNGQEKTWHYTCYDKDRQTRAAYASANTFQDIEACAYGSVGQYGVRGLLTLEAHQQPFSTRTVAYTVTFDGGNSCGVSLAHLSGAGTDL